jgi:hypothetical protein
MATLFAMNLASASPAVVVHTTPRVHVSTGTSVRAAPTAVVEVLSVQALNTQDRDFRDEIYLQIDGRRVTKNLSIFDGEWINSMGRDRFRIYGTQTFGLWESDPGNYNDDLIGKVRIAATGRRGVKRTVAFTQRGVRYQMTYVLR